MSDSSCVLDCQSNPLLPKPLDDVLILPHVRQALIEDLGRRGDITSEACIPVDMSARLEIRAREAGVICGMGAARLAFYESDQKIKFIQHIHDGTLVSAGSVLATVTGNARQLLTAERTALNFLTHLSGIASATRDVVDRVVGTNAQITCSRKTIPGLRALQKYAVRAGGGRNHRMGLDDAILIKDNHIAICGDIKTALEQARRVAGHLIPIEIEVDTIEQLALALDAGADFVLLDNMAPEMLTQAVAMCQGHAQTEASGGITPDSVAEVAATGVDFIAMGYLTHSTKALDIGLDIAFD